MKTKETKGSGIMDDLFIDLCTLKLNDGRFYPDMKDLDKIILELTKKKPNLKKLKLRDGYQMSNEDVELIMTLIK